MGDGNIAGREALSALRQSAVDRSKLRLRLAAELARLSNKASGFSNVYNSLLRETNPYLKVIPPNWQDTLELLRLIRNAVHNSWVYSPEYDKNASITFKGNTYNFVVGKKLDFIRWDLLADIAEDVLRIVVAVARDQNVVSLPPITDPGAGDTVD